MFTEQACIQAFMQHCAEQEVGADPRVVINKAAPVQQLHHSLEAEHGLARQLCIIRDHA